MRQAEVELSGWRSLGRRLSSEFAALATSAVMTMRIFGEPPSGRLRRQAVIEQVYEDGATGGFDPREVVAERFVLTVPLPAESSEHRTMGFSLN